MPIEMPKGLPFSVDTWTPVSKKKDHHFLTHAHKDHAQGIVTHASYPIYSTLFSKTLLLHSYPQLDGSLFVSIEIGQYLIINDPDGDFTVTAYDANHCPGSVMFLFEGYFGNILHTGDCRLTPDCLQSLPEKYIGKKNRGPECPLDYIFLDCTFGQFMSKMPSRDVAIQLVIKCIWKHPDAPKVHLCCDMLGQEQILVEVSKTFGEKIYINDNETNTDCFKSLELIVPDNVITHDPSSRFHLFDGFPKLYERAEAKITEARANFEKEPLIIRPSAQWYATCDDDDDEGFFSKRRKERFDEAVRDVYGVWHVCYSMHSSKDELEWALQLLAPKWVVSTTTNCRAMELDYVKKHCLKNKPSFCRLMDISCSVESLDHPDISIKTSSSISNSCIEIRSEPVVISTPKRKRLSLSPPCKRPTITLFGRARLGCSLDSGYQHEQKETVTTIKDDSLGIAFTESEDMSCQKENVAEEKFEKLLAAKRTTDFVDIKCSSTTASKTWADIAASVSPIGLSKGYSENLRRLYRSRNVPVPQPLPSLVKLMEATNLQRRVYKLRFPLTDQFNSSSYL